MRLDALVHQLSDARARGDLSREVHAVTRDSRDVRRGVVFVAIEGSQVDGHDFVGQLGEAGAVVVQRPVEAAAGVPVIEVANTRKALGEAAACVQGHPSRQVSVVGVTGTNGKTTVTTLVEQALLALGLPAARAGTTGWFMQGEARPSELTTPEAPALQAFIADAARLGCRTVALEVSSIGLDQHRVTGTEFHLAVLTNLRRDHLDYHGTIDAYIHAKSRLFTDLLRPAGGHPRALIWNEEPLAERMHAPSDHWTYGFGDADLSIVSWSHGRSGMTLRLSSPMGEATLMSPLVGRYNALNLCAAFGVLLTLDVSPAEAARGLGTVPGVVGRLEVVPSRGGLVVLVDYAHTADALEAALSAARDICEGRLWVVFGCGGDRDQGKRPEMGAVAARLADRVVVTSDNPRSENPQQIIDQILEGMDRRPTWVEPSRADAIAWTIREAGESDVIVLAGKGHETYQEIDGTRIAFDDRVEASKALAGRP